eukprot:4111288-Pyramimonas_sp.AAC.1
MKNAGSARQLLPGAHRNAAAAALSPPRRPVLAPVLVCIDAVHLDRSTRPPSRLVSTRTTSTSPS